MSNFWNINDNLPGFCDCFVVLSYALKNNKEPTLLTKKLIEKVRFWQKKFPKSHVIMSTGDNQFLGVTNARVMAIYGQKIGIPKKCIIEEDKSVNTYENLKFSFDIIRKKGFKKITLVMHDLHARRTLAIARSLSIRDINWISVYTKGDAAYGYKKIQTCSRLSVLTYEIVAYIYGVVLGQIKKF